MRYAVNFMRASELARYEAPWRRTSMRMRRSQSARSDSRSRSGSTFSAMARSAASSSTPAARSSRRMRCAPTGFFARVRTNAPAKRSSSSHFSVVQLHDRGVDVVLFELLRAQLAPQLRLAVEAVLEDAQRGDVAVHHQRTCTTSAILTFGRIGQDIGAIGQRWRLAAALRWVCK